MNFAELLIYLLCMYLKLKNLKSSYYINHELLLSSFKVLMKVHFQPIRGHNDYQNMNFKKSFNYLQFVDILTRMVQNFR